MTAPSGEGFPKVSRVRRRREYLALTRGGRRREAPHVVIQLRPNAGISRLGITVSRKIGGAVARNRVKRRVREIFRRHPARLVPAHDLVVVARPGAADLAFRDLEREITAAINARSPRRKPA